MESLVLYLYSTWGSEKIGDVVHHEFLPSPTYSGPQVHTVDAVPPAF